MLLQAIPDPVLHGDIALALAHARQIAAERTYVRGDGHLVVVQQHDHSGVALAGVVQRLIAHAPGQGPVAHQRHDVVFAAHDVPGPGHAKGGGYGRGGMARRKRVVFAFILLGKAADAALLAKGVKGPIAPGQKLVGVGLVPHVHHELVLGGVEHVVHGHGQLHHPQVGGQVAAVLRDHVDDLRAQLLAELLQLLDAQLFQVCRFVYLLYQHRSYSGCLLGAVHHGVHQLAEKGSPVAKALEGL